MAATTTLLLARTITCGDGYNDSHDDDILREARHTVQNILGHAEEQLQLREERGWKAPDLTVDYAARLLLLTANLDELVTAIRTAQAVYMERGGFPGGAS